MYRLATEASWSSDQLYHSFLGEAVKLGIQVTTGVVVDYTGKMSEQEVRFITGPGELRPTAIVSWCDNYAMAAYEFLKDRDIPIGTPDGVAVIGFDGFVILGVPVRLTSVQIEWDQVAVTAIKVLLKVIAGESVPKLTTLPVKLIAGQTG